MSLSEKGITIGDMSGEMEIFEYGDVRQFVKEVSELILLNKTPRQKIDELKKLAGESLI